jgi:CelD/BcsL family acetyltransferase involved in cellulose biosynthesis
LRLALLKEIPEDTDLRRQWNALVQRMEQPQVFYTYEWALAVYRAYRATLFPLLLLAYDEHSLCGVAALATDPTRKHASFLCAATGDYCDFLSSLERRSTFVQGAFAELRRNGVTKIALANLPADSATVPAIRQNARRETYHLFARTGYLCAQVRLRLLERRGRDKPALPRKKMLRRFLNAMGRGTAVQLDHARTWHTVEPILEQFVQAHVQRFLATGRISNMARPERRAFLAELAKLLSDSGWLVLTRMRSGERTFAWNYGFQFHGTWFWYQPTFDSDLEKYSPGFCLLAKVIEEAAEDPVLEIVDLGLGVEEYKGRFANQTRETLFVTLQTSALAHYRELLRYRTASIVKASRPAEVAVRALLDRAQRARKYFGQRGAAEGLRCAASCLQDLVWAAMQVFFYEWVRSILPPGDLKLRSLDLGRLGFGATAYVDDKATLAYLLRSAQRLRSGKAQGFVLVDSDEKPLHFAWVAPFDGFFLPELNSTVETSSPDAVMLFDCWTPVALRGRGYYGHAIELIANKMGAAGKKPWIVSAASNAASLSGVERTGFERRYSMVRQRALWWQTVKRQPRLDSEETVGEMSARF